MRAAREVLARFALGSAAALLLIAACLPMAYVSSGNTGERLGFLPDMVAANALSLVLMLLTASLVIVLVVAAARPSPGLLRTVIVVGALNAVLMLGLLLGLGRAEYTGGGSEWRYAWTVGAGPLLLLCAAIPAIAARCARALDL